MSYLLEFNFRAIYIYIYHTFELCVCLLTFSKKKIMNKNPGPILASLFFKINIKSKLFEQTSYKDIHKNSFLISNKYEADFTVLSLKWFLIVS